MRRPVIISLSVIAVVAASAVLYLGLYGPDGMTPTGGVVRSTTLVVEHPSRQAPPVVHNVRDLTVALQVTMHQLTAWDWSKQRKAAPPEGVVRNNLAYLAKQHFNTVIVNAVDPDSGACFFQLRKPIAVGLRQGRPLAPLVVAEARRIKLKVLADISGLAAVWTDAAPPDTDQRRDAPVNGQLSRIVGQLLDDVGFDGVVSKGFAPGQVEQIQQGTKSSRRGPKVHIHVHDDAEGNADALMAEDYVGYPAVLEHAGPLPSGVTVTSNLGHGTAVLSHARSVPRQMWVRVSGGLDLLPGGARNVVLLRAAQFYLDGCVWALSRTVELRWMAKHLAVRSLMSEIGRLRRGARGERPVANLVLALPRDDRARREGGLVASLAAGPLVNGLMLAGFDVQTSYGTPLEEAALYAVLAIGRTATVAMDLPQRLLGLLDQAEPVLFVVAGLTNEGNWRSALPKLGIKASWRPTRSVAHVNKVVFADNEVSWYARHFGDLASNVEIIPEAAVSGEILLAAEAGQQYTALVVRAGNKVLVNGSPLHPEASFVINQLARPTLKTPFFGLGVVARSSAFFALHGSMLEVDLPVKEGTELRLIRHGADGLPQPVEVAPYQAPLRALLQRNELLIVEPT